MIINVYDNNGNTFTIDDRLNQMRYVSSSGEIDFKSLGEEVVDSYKYLFETDKESFVNSLADDILYLFDISVDPQDLSFEPTDKSQKMNDIVETYKIAGKFLMEDGDEESVIKESWKGKLQDQYKNFEEFKDYCEMYGNHKRLGFKTPEEAWKANPVVSGSTNPKDYKVVKEEDVSFNESKNIIKSNFKDFLNESIKSFYKEESVSFKQVFEDFKKDGLTDEKAAEATLDVLTNGGFAAVEGESRKQKINQFLEKIKKDSLTSESFLNEKMKNLFETGEMSQKDIEEGGEYYEAAQGLAAACEKIGELTRGLLRFKMVVPFDTYQGPYAMVNIKNKSYKFWHGDFENMFWIEGLGISGNPEQIAEQINKKFKNNFTDGVGLFGEV